jgi:hypothetical protein
MSSVMDVAVHILDSPSFYALGDVEFWSLTRIYGVLEAKY